MSLGRRRVVIYFSYCFHYTLEHEQLGVAAIDGGYGTRHELSTLTWFYFKSPVFNHRTVILFRFKHIKGESKATPVKYSSACVMEGKVLLEKGQLLPSLYT